MCKESSKLLKIEKIENQEPKSENNFKGKKFRNRTP